MNKNSRIILSLIIFLNLCHHAFAQQMTLTGAIVLDRTEVMSYSIIYQLGNKNTLTGYSVSDRNGKEETKARISGTYNPKTKVLEFEEHFIESTKSKTPAEEFCLMKVTGTFEKKAGQSVYTGKFTSKSADPLVICASGTILMMTEEKIEQLSAKVEKAFGELPMSDSVREKAEGKPVDTATWVRNVVEVTPGSVKTMKLHDDQIQIDLVDDRFQDGDKITILKNNERIVSGLEITNKVKSFRFNIGKDENEVTYTFFAEDEGSIALTTLKAFFRNGHEHTLIMAGMNKGQSVKVVFRR
ncbi:hypothetical protein TBC1_12341 [Lentimicrobium saccharophilum]|uniref:Uncharacterized protein n=1 Tax=Lentimicrobium saccharophilum TaxID=1678841 RepID=A0A0S7BU86_9BACT|nr:hypothetical protein [Lentimicrobium saccharophilum]GAP44533.1 hypothetical protein TBC1_12341 [Lentimicrobium saccharophilum]